MSDTEVATFLASRYIATLGTLGATGAPHLVTVGYVPADGALEMCSYANAQKVVNLRRDPRASVLVEDVLPYEDVKGVLMTGEVAVRDDADEAQAIMTRLLARMRSITPDHRPPDVDLARHSRKRVALRFRPDRVVSWDHRRLQGQY